MRNRLLIFIISLTFILPLTAQTLQYSCDFEDQYEQGRWVLNPAATGWQDKLYNWWFIGPAGNNSSTGQNGLFVSPREDGVTATYLAEDQCLWVYRPNIQLPVGIYDLTFDWRLMGKSSGQDAIYVCWIPTQAQQVILSGATSLEPWVINYQLGDSLAHSPIWQTEKIRLSITQNTQNGTLAFLFRAGNGMSVPPSACIDNILIVDHIDCYNPGSLKAEVVGNDIELTWKGTADNYDVRIYNATNDTWTEYMDYAGTSITLSNMDEGAYVFYVRSRCGQYTFSEYVSTSKFISIAANHCINYLDINAQNCSMGDYTNGVIGTPCNVLADYGYYNPKSQHTVHYDPTEYDSNTLGQLKTVPAGAIASVRLGQQAMTYDSSYCQTQKSYGGYYGGWGDYGDYVTYEVENYAQVEYTYTVTSSDQDLLVINWAAVLQDGGHAEVEQPRFTIEVFDGNDLISCANEDFRVGFNTNSSIGGWNEVKTSSGYSSESVFWHDWTTISLSLRNYIGRTLRIRLRAFGCTYDYHYGYVYFTLDCASSEIGGLLCKQPTRTFTAPDGFDYQWYYINDKGQRINLSTDQTFTNQSERDTITYYVEVKSKTKPGCYYTLHASGMPRYPRADIQYRVPRPGCSNEVEFTLDPDVFLINQITGDSIFHSEQPQAFLLDFGDGTVMGDYTQAISHQYSDEGGTFDVRLYTGIDMIDGAYTCDADSVISITLPSLTIPEATEHIEICSVNRDGSSTLPYEWRGKEIMEESEHEEWVILQNQLGCDSIKLWLDIDIYDGELRYYRYDTICSGTPLHVFDSTIYDAGTYYFAFPMENLPCDTVWEVEVTVEPELQINIQDTVVICGDAENLIIPFTIWGGRYDSVKVSLMGQSYWFGYNEPFYFNLSGATRANFYDVKADFYNPICGVESWNSKVQVNYPQSVIAEKDGFMSLINENFNFEGDGPGYVFTKYQWYKDGQPIEGATESYYRAGAGDEGSEFTVLLSREEDNVRMLACPLLYKSPTGIGSVYGNTPMPTQVRTNEQIWLTEPTDIELYDVLGRLLLKQQNVTLLTTPATPGIYLIRTEQTTFKLHVH